MHLAPAGIIGDSLQERPWYLERYKHDWVAAEPPPYLKQAQLARMWMPTSQNPPHVGDGLRLPVKLQTRMVNMVMSRYETELAAHNQKILEQQEIRGLRRQVLHEMRHCRRVLQERSGQAAL